MKTFFNLSLLISLFFLASCNRASIPSASTQIPPQATFSQSVTHTSTSENSNIPTSQSSSTQPAVTSTLPPSKFFTEEWIDGAEDWKWFSTIGDDNLWDVYTEAGVLVYYLTGRNIQSYFIYRPWDYDEVTITTRIENRTETKNSFVLVCQYSDFLGWYEADIESNGLWQLRAHDTKGHTGYLELQSGGTQAFNSGLAVNDLSLTCNGNTISLTINGKHVTQVSDKILNFTSGKVGLGVLSSSQVPILIESDWVEINQP